MINVSHVAAYTVKKLWLALAFLLVLFAVALSLLRYALPHLDGKKHLLEDYLSNTYGVEMAIESVHAVWQGNGPSIVLNQVTLAQNEASPVAMQVDQIYVEVDFWQSLTQRMLTSNQFDLIGVHVSIDAQRLSTESETDFPIVSALRSLFLEQLQSFSLDQGLITVSTENKTSVFELDELVWVNLGERHQGRGAIRVQELTGNSALFILDLEGGNDDLTGTFYAKGDSLDISPWVSEYIHTKLPLDSSSANLEVWAGIANNQIDSIQTRFEDTTFAWSDGITELNTFVRSGMIQALPLRSGWALRVDQLLLEAGDETLMTDFVGLVDHNGNTLLNTVKPLPLTPFLALQPLISGSDEVEWMQRLKPHAQLATLQLNVRKRGLSLAAKLLDIEWQQVDYIPGLSGLEGEIFWHKNRGMLEVSAQDTTLAINNLLPQNLAVDEIDGRLFLYQEEQDWALLADKIHFVSPTLSFDQRALYLPGSNKLYSQTTLSPVATGDVASLLPAPLMGNNTAKYLSEAFTKQGQIESAAVLWSGKLDQFPYANNEGIFQASVSIRDSEFRFSPDWPELARLDLDLMFENYALYMSSERGQLHGISLSNLYAEIPQLTSDATLMIEAQARGEAQQLKDLMLNSSLKDALGALLRDDVQVTGALQTSLNLSIPLNSNNVIATGIAQLEGNTVTVPAVDITLQQVSGAVRFHNEKISADDVAAEWLGQPIVLDLMGEQHTAAYALDIGLAGDWDVAPLVEHINPELTAYVSGHSNWQSNIGLALTKQGFDYTATAQAGLANVNSLLPAPFNSDSTQSQELLITSRGNQQVSTVEARLGDNARFDGILPHQEMQFSRAHLALGESDFVGMGVGFSVSAGLEQVDFSDWYKTIELITAGQTGARKSLFSVPERIFVRTSNFNVAQQTLNDVELNVKQQNNNWVVDVNAEQARAKVTLYDQWLERGIDIEADFLRFDQITEPAASAEHKWELANLPPVRLHCKQCSIMGRDLGEINLDVARHRDGMEIRQLSARAKHGELAANGWWYLNDLGSQTTLKGTIKSDDVGLMLAGLGLDAGIKDSEANIDFTLDWDDTPFDFSFAKLDGAVDWELSDGYLTELSDKGSRLLTLFSLGNMVRKLSLDFRDVFARGFFYDGMEGTLNIAKGKASTSDTVVDGGAGEIDIEGYTDLVSKRLNYNVAFTPNVTGNLPILMYFMVNPPTALAALALDQVLTSAKVISNVNYRVTGTIDEPMFEEVSRDSKDVALPARTDEQPKQDDKPLDESLQPLQLEIIDG